MHLIPQSWAHFHILVSVFPSVGLIFALFFYVAAFITNNETLKRSCLVAFGILGLIPLTKLIYHIVMECSPKQATYGKQILRIKVCDLYGERVSPGKSIARNLFKLFSLITIVGYLLSFFNKKQQCLHDMMAETLVMKDRLF